MDGLFYFHSPRMRVQDDVAAFTDAVNIYTLVEHAY